MRISLTSEIEEYIRQQLDAGRYKSADELVQLALEYFRTKQDLDRADFDVGEMTKLIAVGQAQADRGELLDGDDALRSRRARRASGQSKRTG